MATEVYATVDGILKHRHGGVWHSAHIKHADDSIHTTEKAAKPTFRDGLTDELKARYFEALAGKSFEFLWAPGKDARGSWRKPTVDINAEVNKVLAEYEESLQEEPEYAEKIFSVKQWVALDKALAKAA